jgi:hypothetical protein
MRINIHCIQDIDGKNSDSDWEEIATIWYQ